MSWIKKLTGLIFLSRSESRCVRPSFRPQLDLLEKRDLPSASSTYQLLANGNLVQTLSSNTTVVVDQGVQSFGVASRASGPAVLIDLHTNGQLNLQNTNGTWSVLDTNVKNASVFSDSIGNATVEVLENGGSFRQYNVATGKWAFIDWSNVTWFQGVPDSTGKLQEIFWLNQYGALYNAQAFSPGSVIRYGVQSVSLNRNADGVSLVGQDSSGTLWNYQQATNSWNILSNQKPVWWQAVTNPDGSQGPIYWLDSSSNLWSWQNGKQQLVQANVLSVSLNATGTPQITTNPILAYWKAIDQPSYLGKPTSGLGSGPGGIGYQMQFASGVILWDSIHGNRVVYGPVYQYWMAQGGPGSNVGLPLGNLHAMTGNPVVQTQSFAQGSLYLANGVVSPTDPTGKIATVLNQLTDPAIRSLTQNLFLSSGLIGRSQIIQILNEVVSQGPITASEMNSLQVIILSASQLNIPADVLNLATNIINGNPANTTYQSTPLGNLQVGSSSSQLQKLIDKWFYGTDEPIPTDSFGKSSYQYVVAHGNLFGPSGTPSYSNVQQGYLGDCYLLASLSDLALKDPQLIESMIVNNHDTLIAGDPTYTVRLWNSNTNSWNYVTVDSRLPVDASGKLVFNGLGNSASSSQNVLWACLIEKAVVEASEEGWMPHPSVNNYSNISIGWPSDALHLLTGNLTTDLVINSETPILNAWNSSGMVILDTFSQPQNSNLVPSHSYVVVNYNPSTDLYTLYNPWGLSGGYQGGHFMPGLVTMTWTGIQTNFQIWDS